MKKSNKPSLLQQAIKKSKDNKNYKYNAALKQVKSCIDYEARQGNFSCKITTGSLDYFWIKDLVKDELDRLKKHFSNEGFDVSTNKSTISISWLRAAEEIASGKNKKQN